MENLQESKYPKLEVGPTNLYIGIDLMMQSVDSVVVEYNPTMIGHRFDSELANELWDQLSEKLKKIVNIELNLGAKVESIQKDMVSQVISICIEGRPRSESFDDDIKVNVKHERGNRCYDGTFMTLTEIPASHFICFIDPGYDHDR